MILVIEWGRPNRIARLLSSVATYLENTVRSETEPSSLEHLSSYFLDFNNHLPDCTKKTTLWISL